MSDLEETMRRGRQQLAAKGRVWQAEIEAELQRRRSLRRRRRGWAFFLLLAASLSAGAYGELTGLSDELSAPAAFLVGAMVGALTAFFYALVIRYPR